MANEAEDDQAHGDEEGGEGEEVGQAVTQVLADVAVQVKALAD